MGTVDNNPSPAAHVIPQGFSMFGIFTRVNEIFHEIKVLCFDKAPTREELLRAPFKLISAASDAIYSSLYITDMILIIGHLFGKITESPLVMSVLSRCILPIALAVSFIDSGLNVDKLIRSFVFHRDLQENDIADFNELLKLLDEDPKNTDRIIHLLTRRKMSSHEYNPISSSKVNSKTQKTLFSKMKHYTYKKIHKHRSSLQAEKKREKILSKAFSRIKITTVAETAPLRERILKKKEEHILLALRHLEQSDSRALALRVGNWGSEKITEELKTLEKKIKDETLSAKDFDAAENLLKILKTQGQKTKIIHVIAITALVITIAACVAAMIGCPFLPVLFLFVIGGTMAFSNWVFAGATLPKEGWQADFKQCFAPWLRDLIFRTPQPKKGEELPIELAEVQKKLVQEILNNPKISQDEANYVAMYVAMVATKEKITQSFPFGAQSDA